MNNPSPLSLAEIAQWRLKAEKGENIPLEITRRFIATIRKDITSSPQLLTKTATTREKKSPLSESEVDFF